jgi:hypothetical protein
MTTDRISLRQIFVALAVLGVFLAVAKATNLAFAAPLFLMVLGVAMTIRSRAKLMSAFATLSAALALLPTMRITSYYFGLYGESWVAFEFPDSAIRDLLRAFYKIANFPLELMAPCTESMGVSIYFASEGVATVRPFFYYHFWLSASILLAAFAILRHMRKRRRSLTTSH